MAFGPVEILGQVLGHVDFVYVRSKSCSQVEPSWQISQRPLIVAPSLLNVPTKRCEKSNGECWAEFVAYAIETAILLQFIGWAPPR